MYLLYLYIINSEGWPVISEMNAEVLVENYFHNDSRDNKKITEKKNANNTYTLKSKGGYK